MIIHFIHLALQGKVGWGIRQSWICLIGLWTTGAWVKWGTTRMKCFAQGHNKNADLSLKGSKICVSADAGSSYYVKMRTHCDGNIVFCDVALRGKTRRNVWRFSETFFVSATNVARVAKRVSNVAAAMCRRPAGPMLSSVTSSLGGFFFLSSFFFFFSR